MKTHQKITNYFLLNSAVITLLLGASSVQAATFDAIGCSQGVPIALSQISSCSESATLEWANAVADAKKYGATPVLVRVRNVSFGEMALPATKLDIQAKAQVLYAELGTERWQAGTDESSVDGTVGIYVTPMGLDMLKKTSNALNFSSGVGKRISWSLSKDGADDALRQEITSKGFVDAVVTVNVDGLVYDIRPNGRLIFTIKNGQIQDFETKTTQLLQSLLPQEVIDTTVARQAIAQVVNGQIPFDPRITIRVNMQGVIRLGANQNVRALVPQGFLDTTQRQFDKTLFSIATSNGTAPTTIVLRDTLNCYCLSSTSRTEQDSTQTRILNDILLKAGLQDVPRVYYSWNWGGWNLTASQLERLQSLQDDRIASIGRAQPMIPTPAAPGSSTVQPNTTSEPPAPDLSVAPILVNTSSIANAVDAVLNWAETQAAATILGKSSNPISQTGAGYRFRYYPTSNSYLGVNETGIPKVYYLGNMSSQKLLDLGYLTDFLGN